MLGSYTVFAESVTKRTGKPRFKPRCVIRVNGGRNLCQNKRGHNIVVVNPENDEYESVSFDTWDRRRGREEVSVVLQNEIFFK